MFISHAVGLGSIPGTDIVNFNTFLLPLLPLRVDDLYLLDKRTHSEENSCFSERIKHHKSF